MPEMPVSIDFFLTCDIVMVEAFISQEVCLR